MEVAQEVHTVVKSILDLPGLITFVLKFGENVVFHPYYNCMLLALVYVTERVILFPG